MKTHSAQAVLLPRPGAPASRNDEIFRMPQEIAGAVTLLAHPLAGAAAVSALGIGLASHAFGIWFGAVSSVAEMSERLLKAMGEDMAARLASFGEDRVSAGSRAAPVASALTADARCAVLVPDKSRAEAAPFAAARTGPARRIEKAPRDSRSKAPPAAVPLPPDDLQAISGIGPRLEKMLNGLGVFRYAEIAAWGEAEIARINAHLAFNGRIERDDWVGQARTLAGNRHKN